MQDLTAEKIIALLDLKPHPKEGGFFRETYRSAENIEAGALPARYAAARSQSTAIYYLLTPGTFSALHRLASDEIFHFYLGLVLLRRMGGFASPIVFVARQRHKK